MKDILHSIFKTVALFLNRKIREWENKKEDKRYNYESLIPTDDINKTDKNRKYSEAILEALERPKVTNIALTGAYGSGKSSLIQSFIKEYPSLFSYLYISLASFPDFIDYSTSNSKESTEETSSNDSKSKLTAKEKKEFSKKIELSILQQIFYHVTPKDIPDSRFKRIKNFKIKRNIYYAIMTALWLIISYLTFSPSWLTKFLASNNLILLNEYRELITFILFSFFGVGLTILVFNLFKYLNNSKIEKLNIKDGEIGISSETSMLNKHLDEIIYFFEKTDYDVIIIEDLDRFEDTSIFSKLREINILLNQSKQIKRKISFLYAIRDDIFKDKDRVKFFDSIIPVIPVINVSNSKDILDKLIGDNKLDLEFIANISFFIDDMRLLKNTVNEYKLYTEKIETINKEQLFSIILFKNLNPADFVSLHKNEGKLYTLISDEKKREIITSIVSNFEDDISKLENSINGIKDKVNLNSAYNKKDLRRIFLLEIIKKTNYFICFVLNGNEVSIEDLLNINESEFISFINNPIQYKYENWSTNRTTATIDNNTINNLKDYSERVKYISHELEKEIKIGQEKINSIKKKNRDIYSQPLHLLLKEYNGIELVYDEKNQELNNLVIYLIKNNYINRNYYDYISYFYEGSLSKDDKQFLSALRYNDNYDINRPLNKIDNVIKEITDYQLNNSNVVLNYAFVGFLLSNLSEYAGKLDILLSRKYIKNSDNFSFVKDYISKGEKVGIFLDFIIPKWEKIWTDLLILENEENNLSIILEVVNIENIKTLDNHVFKNPISKYIESKEDFLIYASQFDIEKIKEIISELDLKFKSLRINEKDDDLLEYIYNNNHYEICIYMINSLLRTYAKDQSILNLEHANYTSIKESSCDKLKTYIELNIDIYSKLLSELEEDNQEKEEFLIELYNNNDIELKNKKAIGIRQQNKISSIHSLENGNIKTFLIKYSLILPSWDNVMRYFIETDKIDEALLAFLNIKENALQIVEGDMEEIAQLLGFKDEELNSFIDKISRTITLCNGIEDDKYKIYMEGHPKTFSDLDFSHLSESKVLILISTSTLGVTSENYERIRHDFINNLHLKLLYKNPAKAVQLIIGKNIVIGSDEYKLLLASDFFTLSQKLEIIFNTEITEFTDSNVELSNIVTKILRNYIETINFNILKSVFMYSSNKSNLIYILLNQMDYLNQSQIAILINSIGNEYSSITISRSRYSIEETDFNLALIDKLISKGLFISTKKIKNKEIKINNKVF